MDNPFNDFLNPTAFNGYHYHQPQPHPMAGGGGLLQGQLQQQHPDTAVNTLYQQQPQYAAATFTPSSSSSSQQAQEFTRTSYHHSNNSLLATGNQLQRDPVNNNNNPTHWNSRNLSVLAQRRGARLMAHGIRQTEFSFSNSYQVVPNGNTSNDHLSHPPHHHHQSSGNRNSPLANQQQVSPQQPPFGSTTNVVYSTHFQESNVSTTATMIETSSTSYRGIPQPMEGIQGIAGHHIGKVPSVTMGTIPNPPQVSEEAQSIEKPAFAFPASEFSQLTMDPSVGISFSNELGQYNHIMNATSGGVASQPPPLPSHYSTPFTVSDPTLDFDFGHRRTSTNNTTSTFWTSVPSGFNSLSGSMASDFTQMTSMSTSTCPILSQPSIKTSPYPTPPGTGDSHINCLPTVITTGTQQQSKKQKKKKGKAEAFVTEKWLCLLCPPSERSEGFNRREDLFWKHMAPKHFEIKYKYYCTFTYKGIVGKIEERTADRKDTAKERIKKCWKYFIKHVRELGKIDESEETPPKEPPSSMYEIIDPAVFQCTWDGCNFKVEKEDKKNFENHFFEEHDIGKRKCLKEICPHCKKTIERSRAEAIVDHIKQCEEKDKPLRWAK
ncbi:hypothetical protein BDA99DRAFT_609791 [Phascolomyces articulosus]|uniref:Uncharacterized protein n=1 Tax=Phascolomyces articulosus TaxID=60185 RepID=A0AAD5JXN7_9FUNG|nr:hypothetical protein BDA99DRAFT_609791 [Phascolomyces articulosus]